MTKNDDDRKSDVIKYETTNKIQKQLKMKYDLIRDEIENTKHD